MYTCSWKHSRPYLTLSFAYFSTKWLHNSLLNHLTPRSNEHVTSPYNLYTVQQTGNKNAQTYQIEVIT